jgi:hypothetical protein
LEVCPYEKSGCDERVDFWRSMMGACGEIRGEFHENSPLAQQDAAARHAEAVNRLLPEDGVNLPQLRTLIDAIMIVRRDIPKEDLPQNSNAVRRVLQGMSLSDLRRVQSILPAVERRRRAEGAD